MLGSMSEYESVLPTEVPADAQLIDVREPDEFAQWHAQGATNLPLSQLQERFGELDLDKDIYMICLSGGRSSRACQWLATNGIEAINVLNGSSGWRDAGLPVVRPEE